MRSPSPATRLRALLLALALLLSATLPAAAQDGLYGPEAPRDVAFVRFVNATDAALEPTLDGATLALLEPGETGPYRTLAPGLHEAGAAGLEATDFEAFPEGFVTVALLAAGTRVLEDAALRDISRGLLSFYNLADAGPLTLRTREGQQVFAEVAEASADAPPPSLTINRAEVGFEIVAAGEVVARLEPRLLERGVAHAVFALPIGEGGGVRIAYVAAELEP